MTITILTRTGLCLAAASLTAGIAFGANPIANAKPIDWKAYNDCLSFWYWEFSDSSKAIDKCCYEQGGRVVWKKGRAVACQEVIQDAQQGPQDAGTEPTKPGVTVSQVPVPGVG